jgi:O-methyltransferase involved in polyketide biosynthesis
VLESLSGALLGPRESDAISPTAHYTGYVWYRNGLSHPALVTPQGRLLFEGLRAFNAGARRIGAPTLEGFLLARHRAIDRLLERAIRDGRVGQVIEIAAGLSPRGWDFTRRHPGLRYIEADLPDMARRKRERLERAGLLASGHRIVELDALADEGPQSLAALAATLDRRQGLAIVTEGLLNYFDREAVLGMWRRFAAVLSQFPAGLYFSDLHVAAENSGAQHRAFGRMLGRFVRGKVYLHFDSAAAAGRALRQGGFRSARLLSPPPQAGHGGAIDARGARLVRVIDAAV